MDPRRRDPAGRFASCGKVLLVGESNPYGDAPAMALWDKPAGAAGDRLRRVLGLKTETYRALHRANLCRGEWSIHRARAVAGVLVAPEMSRPWDVIVMLGRLVANAFHFRGKFFTARLPGDAPGLQGRPDPTLISIPHPSGRCREWHAPGAVSAARTLLERYAPGVPWGEDVEGDSADDWDVRDPRDS